MKISRKLSAVIAASVLLLTGCDNKAPAVPDGTDITTTGETTSGESVPAEKTEATKPGETVSATAAVFEGENDSKKPGNELITDLGSIPYGNYVGKLLVFDGKETMNLNTDWRLEWGDAPDEDGNIVIYSDRYGDRYRQYDFAPYTRFSSGALSNKCDDSFKAGVQSAASSRVGYYSDEMFEFMPTTIHITGSDGRNVYADTVKGGLKAKAYDDMIAVKAFIRRAKEKKGEYENDDSPYYEYIIDPAYMRYMGLPMLETDPEKLKFSINGREVYADTVRGYGAPVSYIENDSIISKVQSGDFIYATIVLMQPSFTYDNVNGALVSGTLMTIEPVTEDTGAVLDGKYDIPAEHESIIEALSTSKGSIIDENTLTADLIDLDFDGTPELLVGSCDEPALFGGPDSTLTFKVYGMKGSFMEELGEFELGDYGNFWLDEADFLTTGEHGWHFMDFKDHCFMTLSGGKLEITKVTEYKENPETDGIGDYYYMGEKVELEPYETVNPLTGKSATYYKWVSRNSLGYSVMSDSGYAVYDMLHDELDKSFVRSRRYDLDPKIDIWGDDTYETGRFKNYYTMSAGFPRDIVDVYYTSERDKDYETFYGLSFEGAKEKPVIYLYPEEPSDVTVKVEFPLGGELTCTYPEYSGGWNVTAMPDGTLYDSNGDEYYCLYWEGVSRDTMDSSEGFCVKGSDTAAFLREKLMYIGLTAREANEFIIYWLPRMQDAPYNVITLHTADYARSVPLDVSPAPDSMIRVFMTYYASDEPVDIPEQRLPHYDREGFTLVEWGGAQSIER